MSVEVYPPLTLSQKGRRRINEDYVFAQEDVLSTADGPLLYLVCDGVGGEARGEVASRLTGETIREELLNNRRAKNIHQAVATAQRAMTRHTDENQEATGMATTLTLLLIEDEQVTIAHLGDSRVYHLRGGEILHKTNDHSFVQELLDNKLITEDQAAEHPRRNVITRAVMQGPDLMEPEITVISELAENDLFFLCSDGVTETFSDDDLLELLNKEGLSDQDRMEECRRRCSLNSNDNFTACLVRLRSLDVVVANKNTSTKLGASLTEALKPLLRRLGLLDG